MKNKFKFQTASFGLIFFLAFFVVSCSNPKEDKHKQQNDSIKKDSLANLNTQDDCEPKVIDKDFYAIKNVELGSFSAKEVLQKLFPGTICHEEFNNKDTTWYVSWKCPNCTKTIKVQSDGEEMETFPYEDRNETRSRDEDIIFINRDGIEIAIVPFSSCYGIGGRLQPGVLGLAYFRSSKKGWELEYFDPFINYEGMFGMAPVPENYLNLKKDVWGCYTEATFVGGASPEDVFFPKYATINVYGPLNGKLAHLLVSPEAGCDTYENYFDTKWSSKVLVDESSNNMLNDIIIVTTGRINLKDWTEVGYSKGDFVDQLKRNAGSKVSFGFVVQRRYSFQEKEYKLAKTDIKTF